MVEILSTLLIISAIIFFGFFAEFLFTKTKIPDILFLIMFGILLGPYVLNYISPDSFVNIAPFFTVFALLFLLFDGAFNIDLISFIKGLTKGLTISVYNFIFSVGIVTGIMYFIGYDFFFSLLMGFILGGVSSAFVIPIIKEEEISKETFSMLALESAITDVLAIVFSLTVIQIMTLNTFNFQFVSTKIASLFAVAGFLGIIAGLIWIVLINKLTKHNKSYMLTIAYLLLLFTLTEYLQGNGAIAALFFGLVLRNSKKITSLVKGKKGYEITTPTERLFYSQISFFLKTFFFVYIGLLMDFSDIHSIIVGAVLSLAILIIRGTTGIFTKEFSLYDRRIVNSIFARGLAAAVLAQLAIESGLPNAEFISRVVFTVIVFTVILSSIRVFIVNKITKPKDKIIQPKAKASK